MPQQRSDYSDDSTISYCFWATVMVLIIYLRVLFLARISALMPPNQVYHSFSQKKCINLCCNSVCRTANVVGYIPRRWQFKVHQTIYSPPPRGRNQGMIYGLKNSGRLFSKYLWKKKLKTDSNIVECSDHQKMPISWKLPMPCWISQFQGIDHCGKALHIGHNIANLVQVL